MEDPEIIKKWFELVRNTIVKYGITDDDIFNFDETGFMMGVIATAKVIIGSERRSVPKVFCQGIVNGSQSSKESMREARVGELENANKLATQR